jgi:diacylglycerol kinase
MRNKFLGTESPGYHPLRKLRVIYSGLKYAAWTDFSVAYKLVLSIVLVLSAFAASAWVDVILILLVTSMVLVAEIFNSAIEGLCDFVEFRHNDKIKAIKDISAAAVGITIFVWIVVIGYECFRIGGVMNWW